MGYIKPLTYLEHIARCIQFFKSFIHHSRCTQWPCALQHTMTPGIPQCVLGRGGWSTAHTAFLTLKHSRNLPRPVVCRTDKHLGVSSLGCISLLNQRHTRAIATDMKTKGILLECVISGWEIDKRIRMFAVKPEDLSSNPSAT